MQGSAPGSLCSGSAIVDRELLLVQLQLLVFYGFILTWRMLQTLLGWESGLQLQLCLGSRQQCLAHGIGRVQMAAQVLEEG